MQRQLDIENSDRLEKAISFVEAKVIEEKKEIPSDDEDEEEDEEDDEHEDGENENEDWSKDDE